MNTLELSAELESIAAGLDACYLLLKEWDDPNRQHDQPSAEQVATALYGLEKHLLRVSKEIAE